MYCMLTYTRKGPYSLALQCVTCTQEGSVVRLVRGTEGLKSYPMHLMLLESFIVRTFTNFPSTKTYL